MSIINQMLKDVEARQQDSGRDAAKLIAGLSQSQNTSARLSRNLRLWLGMSFGIIIGISAAWLHHYFISAPTTTKQAIATSTILPIPALKKTAAAQIHNNTTPANPDIRSRKQHAIAIANAQHVTDTVPMHSKPVQSAPTPMKHFRPLSLQQRAALDYRHAMLLARNQDLPAAMFALENIVRRAPQFLPATISLGAMEIELQRYQAAARVLQHGLALAPQNTALAQLQARLFLHDGKPKQALQTLLSATPLIPQAPDYYGLIAALYEQLGQSGMAAQYYQRLTRLEPDNGKWWMGLGISFEQLHKNNEAILAYQHALASNSLSPTLYTYVRHRIQLLMK